MKALYKKIIERFTSQEVKAAFTEAGLNPIKVVDTYKQQYFNPELFELYPLPAIFFEWGILHSKNPEEASTAIITIHISIEQMRDTSSLSKQLDKSLQYFDYIEQVNKVIQPLTTEQTGKLRLVDEGVVDEQSIESVYKISYECEFSGRKVYKRDLYDYTEGDGDLEIAGGLVDKLPQQKVDFG